MTPGFSFGLIGNPLKHSFSALMHNAAFSSLRMKARYKLFPLEDKELKVFFAGLNKKNIRGLNITIPYKEKVLKLFKGTSNNAVIAIGAANTVLVDKSKGLKFYNTDYLGFLRHIGQLKLKPRRVAIIGAGGASRAVCFALGKKKAHEVSIYDIDHFRSLSLMKKFNDTFPDSRFKAVGRIEELNLKEKDLLVNASSVGLKTEDPLLIDPNMLHKGLFVYDLIYNPKETKLLKLAKEEGLSYANGLGMLLYQGVESFNIWIGKDRAPVKVMQEALSKAVYH
ncbi:MAG: shikimate dehydrogenase [Candidatus Omnitrophica bacterium]|nr:shikimate dehydrogenase [Candidatus Omnitrophota bacterium]